MNKIIIKGTNWIGDVFLSLPAVYGLKHLIPDARIDIALKRPLGELVRGVPVIDNILDYDSGVKGEIALIRTIRKGRYDLGIIFPRSLHSAMLLFSGKVKERVGYATDLRSPLLTIKLPRTKEIMGVHQSAYYRNLISVLGDPGPIVVPALKVKKEHTDWAKGFLSKNGYRGGTLIGINPGAAYGQAKRWYPERFAKVADSLLAEFGGKAIIFGGRREIDAEMDVAKSMSHLPILTAGRTTIPELMALVRACSVFITNDTGPMHIASALSVPVVAIFGPTNPKTTFPMAPRKRLRIIRHEVSCSPCLLRSCPEDHRCMTLIKPDEVIAKARGFLKQGA